MCLRTVCCELWDDLREREGGLGFQPNPAKRYGMLAVDSVRLGQLGERLGRPEEGMWFYINGLTELCEGYPKSWSTFGYGSVEARFPGS